MTMLRRATSATAALTETELALVNRTRVTATSGQSRDLDFDRAPSPGLAAASPENMMRHPGQPSYGAASPASPISSSVLKLHKPVHMAKLVGN